ncbi:hypothetical protein KCP75_21270 [Salmonella enterica subsp. enterica]|nr:hypothetical protein KCP75_21270 [Salmonella enterica subsp. enterica]
MLKQLVALYESFVGILPLSLTLLKARDLRETSANVFTFYQISFCCRQKQPVLRNGD